APPGLRRGWTRQRGGAHAGGNGTPAEDVDGLRRRDPRRSGSGVDAPPTRDAGGPARHAPGFAGRGDSLIGVMARKWATWGAMRGGQRRSTVAVGSCVGGAVESRGRNSSNTRSAGNGSP